MRGARIADTLIAIARSLWTIGIAVARTRNLQESRWALPVSFAGARFTSPIAKNTQTQGSRTRTVSPKIFDRKLRY
jgi:hypothetical protein